MPVTAPPVVSAAHGSVRGPWAPPVQPQAPLGTLSLGHLQQWQMPAQHVPDPDARGPSHGAVGLACVSPQVSRTRYAASSAMGVWRAGTIGMTPGQSTPSGFPGNSLSAAGPTFPALWAQAVCGSRCQLVGVSLPAAGSLTLGGGPQRALGPAPTVGPPPQMSVLAALQRKKRCAHHPDGTLPPAWVRGESPLLPGLRTQDCRVVPRDPLRPHVLKEHSFQAPWEEPAAVTPASASGEGHSVSPMLFPSVDTGALQGGMEGAPRCQCYSGGVSFGELRVTGPVWFPQLRVSLCLSQLCGQGQESFHWCPEP